MLDRHLVRRLGAHEHLSVRVQGLLESRTSVWRLSRCMSGLQRHLVVRQHLPGLLRVINALPLGLIGLRELHRLRRQHLPQETELHFLACENLRKLFSPAGPRLFNGSLVDVFLPEPLSSGAHALFRMGIYT